MAAGIAADDPLPALQPGPAGVIQGHIHATKGDQTEAAPLLRRHRRRQLRLLGRSQPRQRADGQDVGQPRHGQAWGGAKEAPKANNDIVSGDFGVSNFQAKKQAVDQYYENNITAENVNQAVGALRRFVGEDVPAVAKEYLGGVVAVLTPGFVKRFQDKKIHIKEVEDREQ